MRGIGARGPVAVILLASALVACGEEQYKAADPEEGGCRMPQGGH